MTTGDLLWQVTLSWQRAIRATLEPHDLTHAQYVLLTSAAELGDAPTPHEIAEHAGTDPVLAGQVLRRLAARQLVTRQLDDADPKLRRIAVTDAGRALLAAAAEDVAITDAEFFVVLGPDAAAFRRGLAALRSG
ncbi:MAG TPA: MarR family transcriptional regulator [Pseudonocardiaceae bacterium]|nr:MarR family transcriptional regulator [Pseudonocardiaceae bacterium]